MFQREWGQTKIKDNRFPDPGSGKGQGQVPSFSGSHVHPLKARKQRTRTMLLNGWNSVLHLLCVHLRRTIEILPFSEPTGEENHASKYQPALPLVRQSSLGLHSPSAQQLWLPFWDAALPAGRAGWWEATPCQADMNTGAVTAWLLIQLAGRCLLTWRCPPKSLFHLCGE